MHGSYFLAHVFSNLMHVYEFIWLFVWHVIILWVLQNYAGCLFDIEFVVKLWYESPDMCWMCPVFCNVGLMEFFLCCHHVLLHLAGYEITRGYSIFWYLEFKYEENEHDELFDTCQFYMFSICPVCILTCVGGAVLFDYIVDSAYYSVRVFTYCMLYSGLSYISYSAY